LDGKSTKTFSLSREGETKLYGENFWEPWPDLASLDPQLLLRTIAIFDIISFSANRSLKKLIENLEQSLYLCRHIL